LGRRPWPVEDEGLAPELRPDRRRELAEMPGIEPDVMGDHQARGRGVPPARQVLPRVAEEPDDGPAKRHVVQHVAPDRRVLGASKLTGTAGLGGRRDGCYGPPANSAGAELKLPVEAV